MKDEVAKTFMGATPVNITVDSSPNTQVHIHLHVGDQALSAEHELMQTELRQLLQWASKSGS